jgi:hypothetical protein
MASAVILDGQRAHTSDRRSHDDPAIVDGVVKTGGRVLTATEVEKLPA